MGKAVIHVSPVMLTKILRLPEGYTIGSVHASASYWNRDGLTFILDSDKLPEVEEGEEYPVAIPSYYIDEFNRVAVGKIDLYPNEK